MGTGYFSGIENTDPLVQAEYFNPGRYLVRIDGTTMKFDRKKVPMFVVETTVVKIMDDPDGRASSEGTSPSFLVKTTNDYFLREVQGFVAGVLGIEPKEVSEGDCDDLTEKQPLNGHVVELICREVPVKDPKPNGPKVITRHRWVRRVPFREVCEVLGDSALRFWKEEQLADLVRAEAS